MKKDNMCVERKDIINILDDKLETVNTKLDYIKEQTTRTNSRVNRVEDDVIKIKLGDAGRAVSCPQLPTIKEQSEHLVALQKSSMTQKQLRNVIIKGITITGLFFTVLFGLITLILRYADIIISTT